jgi:molybdopterin synthase catalytic subunit
MPAIIVHSAFDPYRELADYQSKHMANASFGAAASFVGSMRDYNIGEQVSHMTLEHYPGMTERYLEQLCERIRNTRDIIDCLVIHRVGDIRPGEPIVLTVAWSAHRAEAFAACRELMEELKSGAPFWKKEVTDKGERWVHNDQPEDSR